MDIYTKLHVKKIYDILREHKEFSPFRITLERLQNDNIPMTRYIKYLIDTDFLRPNMEEFFGPSPLQASKIRFKDVIQKIPEYKNFFQKHNFHYEKWLNPSHFVHDMIGHILLGNSISGKGELRACSGVMGFCPSTGNDYFVCSLLIFSLGIPIFDDVKPQSVNINYDLAKQMNDMFNKGKNLRDRLGFKSLNKYTTMSFVLLEWENIKMYFKEILND